MPKLLLLRCLGLFLSAVAFIFAVVFVVSHYYPEHFDKNLPIVHLSQITTICSNVSDVLMASLAAVGLLLGYYYYKSRVELDDNTERKRRVRKRMQFLLDELVSYDLFVKKILYFLIEDSKDLTLNRYRVEDTFDRIASWLEHNDKLFGFSNDEIKDILAVNSFVDKNDLITTEEFESLDSKRAALLAIKPEYAYLFRKARFVCMDRME